MRGASAPKTKEDLVHSQALWGNEAMTDHVVYDESGTTISDSDDGQTQRIADRRRGRESRPSSCRRLTPSLLHMADILPATGGPRQRLVGDGRQCMGQSSCRAQESAIPPNY